MDQGGMPLGGMQRNQAGDHNSQLHFRIIHELQSNHNTLPPGWQQTYDLRDRATRILELITQLRFLQPDVMKCLHIAQGFETRSLLESLSKEEYIEKVKQKLDDIAAKRRNMAGLQGMPMGMNGGQNMGMMHNVMNGMQNMQQQNGFGQNPLGFGNAMGGMQGMMPNNQMAMSNVPNGTDAQQAFNTRLQRQMQPSPITHQLPQQPQNNVMNPNSLQTAHNLQAPNMGHSASQQPQAEHMGAPQGVNAGRQHTQDEVLNLARALYNRMPEEKKNSMRTQFINSLNEHQREQARAATQDPLMRWFVQKAREMLMRNGQRQQHPQGAAQAQANNPQRGMQQGSGATGSNIDFTGILAQQANALKSQESGEQVVPPSNNPNFGLGNMVGMPQGMNAQMMNGQNPQQASNQQVTSQMQYLMMQQENKQRLQRSNMLQQQAMAAQQQQGPQLRGQPGGLNAPNVLNGGSAAQLNSPAMSMLNRPMVPPGQNNPVTSQQPQQTPSQPSAPQSSQQNRSQMAQTAAREASQLQQHHQQMMNQNQNKADTSQSQAQQQQQQQNQAQQQQQQHQQQQRQQQQQQQQQQRQKLMQFMQNLPPEMRDKLSSMTPQQVQDFFLKKRASMMNAQGSGQNMLQGDLNMMGGQSGTQAGLFNGMPVDSSNAGPAFNAQMSQGQQQGAIDSQLALQQRLQHQQQQAQMKQRAMDIRPFPRVVLNQLQIANIVPQNIHAWGPLKEFVRQNQPMMVQQGIFEKLLAAQNQWFAAHPEELSAGVQALRAHLAAQQGGQQQQLQHQQMGRMVGANGQAPAAPMLTPGGPMHMPNAAPLNAMQNPGLLRAPNVEQTTQQEVQAFRGRLGASAHNLSDDQIRQLIWRRKVEANTKQVQEQLFQQQQQQQAVRNAQMQRAQASASQNSGSSTNPMQGFANQQVMMPPTQMPGQKRPQTGSDDVVEIPNPNGLAKMGPAQTAPPPNAFSLPAGFPKGFPTMDQLEKMQPQQRQMYMNQLQHYKQRQAALAQQANQPAGQPGALTIPMYPQLPQKAQMDLVGLLPLSDAEIKQRITAILSEVQKTAVKGPPVELDGAAQAQARMLLKKLWPPLNRIQDTFALALRAPTYFNEARIRDTMRAKLLISQNIADTNGNFKDYLSLTIPQLKEIEGLVQAYLRDVKTLKERIDQAKARMQAGSANGSSTGANVSVPGQSGNKSVPQNTPQDKTMPRTASQQSQPRKPSTSTKVPPAPIDNKTHDWGALSPHGVPKYEPGRNELTPDKLKFPPTKRRRTNQAESPASTPLNQGATPSTTSPAVASTKTATAEHARKMHRQAQVEADQKETQPKFRCKDLLCEASITGFATEEELTVHSDTVHSAIGDPLTFFLESAAKALETDQDGNPLETSPTKSATAKAGASAKGVLKKESTGASIKSETATAAKSLSDTASLADQTKKLDSSQATEQTLRHAVMENIGLTSAEAIDTAATDASALALQNDEGIFNAFSADTLANIEGLDDWAQLIEVDEWKLGSILESSPSLTPSDGNSQSSHSSDISQSDRLRMNLEWDPFGNGDVFVPDSLRVQALGLNDGDPTLSSEAIMTDISGESHVDEMGKPIRSDANVKVDEKTWDWSGDLDQGWDEIFGDTADIIEM